MDARTLARLLIVDYVTVDQLQKGDIIVFDWNVVLCESVVHTTKPDTVELLWSSDGDTGSVSYATHTGGSKSKWQTVTIINRVALRPPKSERKPS